MIMTIAIYRLSAATSAMLQYSLFCKPDSAAFYKSKMITKKQSSLFNIPWQN